MVGELRTLPTTSAAMCLGIELDLDAIAEHPYSPHPMRLFTDAVPDIRPKDARSSFRREGQLIVPLEPVATTV